MAEAELVNRIVRQVVAALGGGGAQSPATRITARPAKPRASVKRREKKFITEQMLSRRISIAAGGGGATVSLACNEHLTPAAADLAEEKHLTVTRATTPMMAAAADGKPEGTIAVITARADAKVASVVSSLCYDGLAMADYNAGECWLENLRGLCEAVGCGAVAAGVAILPYAADAMVVANKTRGVRAVQGTQLESVAAALRHFDANVLVVEHAFCMFHEMRAMVRMFAARRTAAVAGGAVCEAISKLERA